MPGGGVGTGGDGKKRRLLVYGLVSSEVQSVLGRLQEVLGPSLHIISSDTDHIIFHVWGNSDQSVFQKLNANKEQLFSSATARGSKPTHGIDNRGSEFIRVGADDNVLEFRLAAGEGERGIVFRY
jgi:hypothetical protein